MKSDIDYEQLYYDTLNIDLQKYIMLQIERRKDGKTSTKKKV